MLRSTILPDGAEPVEPLAVPGRQVLGVELSFKIAPNGRIGECRPIGEESERAASALGDACALLWAFGLNDWFMPGEAGRSGVLRAEAFLLTP